MLLHFVKRCYNTREAPVKHRNIPGRTEDAPQKRKRKGGVSMGSKRKVKAKAEAKAEVKAMKKSQPRQYTLLTLVLKLKLILRRL